MAAPGWDTVFSALAVAEQMRSGVRQGDMLNGNIPMLRISAVVVLGLMLVSVNAPNVEAHLEGDHIPGLTPASVIAYFEDFGLTCDNNGEPNGVDPEPGKRGADCSATFPERGAQVSVLLNYFDDGHVESVWTSVFEQDPGVPGTVDPDFAFEWSDYVAELPYTTADPEKTKAWVRERVASGECGLGCSLDVGVGVWFMAGTPDRGPGQLDLTGSAPLTAPPATPTPAPTPAPVLPNTALPAP